MPRPIKWRRVENIPEFKYFIPVNVPKCELEENILKVEELEAIRLKDLEGLDQEACAERMEVSRQTFQRIYNMAKEKVADSLINGKAIRVEGGNYTQNICVLKCENCGYKWESRVEDIDDNNDKGINCPECGSVEVHCTKSVNFCHRGRCGKRRGRGFKRGIE